MATDEESIRFSCSNPACRRPLRAHRSKAGKRVKCPACGSAIVILTHSDDRQAADKDHIPPDRPNVGPRSDTDGGQDLPSVKGPDQEHYDPRTGEVCKNCVGRLVYALSYRTRQFVGKPFCESCDCADGACPNCGKLLPSKKSKQCTACQAIWYDSALDLKKRRISALVCPKCNAVNPSGTHLCRNCGFRLCPLGVAVLTLLWLVTTIPINVFTFFDTLPTFASLPGQVPWWARALVSLIPFVAIILGVGTIAAIIGLRHGQYWAWCIAVWYFGILLGLVVIFVPFISYQMWPELSAQIPGLTLLAISAALFLYFDSSRVRHFCSAGAKVGAPPALTVPQPPPDRRPRARD